MEKKMKARLKKYKKAEVLSSVLYHLTTKNPIHRAYEVEEILDACDVLGLHPSNVDNDTIPIVFSWLKENKG